MFGGLTDWLWQDNKRAASDQFRRRLSVFNQGLHEERRLAEEYPAAFPDYKWGGFTIAELLLLKSVICRLGYDGRVEAFCTDIMENGMPSQRELLAKECREQIAKLQEKVHTLETKP